MFPDSEFLFSPASLLFSEFNSLTEFDEFPKDIFLSTVEAEEIAAELRSKESLANIPEVDNEVDDFNCCSIQHCDTIPEIDEDCLDCSLKHDETINGGEEDEGCSLKHSDLIHVIQARVEQVDQFVDDCSVKLQGDIDCVSESSKAINENPFNNISLFTDDETAGGCCSMSMSMSMSIVEEDMPNIVLIPSSEPKMEEEAAVTCDFVVMDETMALPSFHVSSNIVSPRTLAATSCKMNSMSLMDEIDASQKANMVEVQGIKALDSISHLPPLSPYRRNSISPILSCTVDAASSPSPLFTLPQAAVTTVTETLMLNDIEANSMLLGNVDVVSNSRSIHGNSPLKLQDMEFPHPVYDFSRIQAPQQDSFIKFSTAASSSQNSSAIQRSHSSHDLGQLRASINHALCHDSEPPSELDTFLSRNSDAVSSLQPRHRTWNAQQFIVRPASSSMRRVFSTGDLQVFANYGGNLESPRTEESASSRIGHCSVEERKMKLHRYRQKRNERNFTKKIKYACRKTLADSRPRIKGRFARTDESEEPQSLTESCSIRNRHPHPHPEASCIMSRSCTMANTPPRFWTAVGMNVAM